MKRYGGRNHNSIIVCNINGHLRFSRVSGSINFNNKKYSKMVETLIKVVAGFTVVFFTVGIVAVLWQVAKYMATRGMKEDEKYES